MVPNIWTHILFCEDVVDAVNGQFLSSEYEKYLKLGAQGPDPFFYYNFWPWKKDSLVNNLGHALHTRQCGPFLIDLIKSAKDKNKFAKAYVVGFITHHILDRNTHPFIHYYAGYEGANHQRLEIRIDTHLMEKYHRVNTWKTQVYKEIDVGRIDPETIELLLTLIQRHYSEFQSLSTDSIVKAYKDMILALRVLSDPRGWKNKVLSSYISPYSHQPIKEEKDFLNLKKETWYHSATNEASTKSFPELFEESRYEAIEVLLQLKNYWETDKESYLEKIEELIGNISYDTGMPLSQKLENKYSNPII